MLNGTANPIAHALTSTSRPVSVHASAKAKKYQLLGSSAVVAMADGAAVHCFLVYLVLVDFHFGNRNARVPDSLADRRQTLSVWWGYGPPLPDLGILTANARVPECQILFAPRVEVIQYSHWTAMKVKHSHLSWCAIILSVSLSTMHRDAKRVDFG